MGVGDYIRFTLHGGAPWGFSLRTGDGGTFQTFLVSQVDEGGHASEAGVLEGDEVVSMNGEPCADLTLLQACAVMDTTLDCLQLLATENVYTITKTLPARKPCRQHGVLLASPSMLQQVEVILQQPSASGRGIKSLESVQGGPVVSGTQSEGEEGGGGQSPVPPGSLSVLFQVPSEEDDSDSEGDQKNPTKHRAKTARLCRSESQSEKQLKEAKSKCKRIALLLTAAQNNPNNKGVLMFKKHQQRAKRYTLVSYGTGEGKQEYSSDEEDRSQENSQVKGAVEFNVDPLKDPELKTHLLRVGQSSTIVLNLNREKGLLEFQQNLENQVTMESLPDSQGKGALMFAQRRQRMDEIAAEHEELRRQGIPVEGMQDSGKMNMEQSYMQSTGDSNTYIDVNIHQQGQQQYYEQQHCYQLQYEQQQLQQQQYQQQEQYQQQFSLHHQPQYQQHEQELYQHQQMSMNGHNQNIDMQSSHSNRTAKPFSVQNIETTSYSGQGEQIASRDERISTPAIRTGLLDSKKRNAGKPMFTFKEAPKVSPNPALLNLLNKGDKKLGVESGPEEDYLSLGAEACNFLQSSRVKPKVPPPVAPKPLINPNSPPWTPQMEASNQEIPLHAEISVSVPSDHPITENASISKLESTSEAAPAPTTLPVLQETLPRESTEDQAKLTTIEPVLQQPVGAQEDNHLVNAYPQPHNVPQKNWAADPKLAQPSCGVASWHPTQSQQPPTSQSLQQQSWVPGHTPIQGQGHPQCDNWAPQLNESWSQPQEMPKAQPIAQPLQGKTPPQVQPPWVQSQEGLLLEQQKTWSQPQESMQQHLKGTWLKGETPPQPPWVQQCEQKPQAQPPWAQPSQTASQQQPPWMQPSHQQQGPQHTWPPSQLPVQNQTPWVTAQPQTQQQQHLPANVWTQKQPPTQPQPPWVQVPQVQPQAQPHPQGRLNSWAPVPSQTQSQPQWSQQPVGQHNMSSWGAEENQAQPPTWVQSTPPEPTPQPNWKQATSSFPPQSQIPSWPPAQTQPQWAPQSQQNSLVNTQPSPKPWDAPQSSPSSQTPKRINSFPIAPRDSSPVNPMATVLNPSSTSAYEMPPVRGKGADMFAKRQSRMEKFVVDSETVEANKASRSTSPAASLPNEWKYTPNVRAPPPRAYNPIQSPFYPPAAIKQPPSSGPSTKTKKKDKDQQPKIAPKPLNVVDVMKHQPYQLNASLFTYGPAVEVTKEPMRKPDCSPANPAIEYEPVSYEQVINTQPIESPNAQYPPQIYGMPLQPIVHDGHYQQLSSTYPQANPYQQPPPGPYQQVYPQQYQQTPTLAFQPQPGQSLNLPYPQPQLPYQPQNSSPPYLAAPTIPFPQQSANAYGSPCVTAAAQPESSTACNPVTAPKPKYTAKSTALVWKPAGVEKHNHPGVGFTALAPVQFGPNFLSQTDSDYIVEMLLPYEPAKSPRSPGGSLLALSGNCAVSPLARATSRVQQQPGSSSLRRPAWSSKKAIELQRGKKPPTPWEAASRHPLGLVDEAFIAHNEQRRVTASVQQTAQRKVLPRNSVMGILTYLDAWLVLAASRDEACRHTAIVLDHIRRLGFAINFQKSALQPSCCAQYLGVFLTSRLMTALLSDERLSALLDRVASARSALKLRASEVMTLLGLMSAAHPDASKLGLLRTRRLQRWFARHCPDSVRHSMRWLFLSTPVIRGLGGALDEDSVGGRFARLAHINQLELMAVEKLLLHLAPHHVMVGSGFGLKGFCLD
ncbi:synaptopodin-2 [Neosynchiropus ocellatus]